jgi:hypothetical protein
MKLNVSRQLRGGFYMVSFRVGDFSPEEVQKMQSFGVPSIELVFTPAGFTTQGRDNVPLNQVSEKQIARFQSENSAREYETRVLEQIRSAMQTLRERKDDFSGSDEVAI